jgi:acyl carrier protein
MVPAVFVRVDALPVGLHGKIDRGALPEPGPANTLRDGAFQAPRTQVEERVAGLVQSLLGVQQVSVEDNFFLLGGHSLLGTQLIARICSAFGVELGLRSVFESPTVAQLSTKIEQLLIAKLDTMTEEEALLQLQRHGQAVSS